MLRFRSQISQLCAIFPYSCLHFVFGALQGFQIILIAELNKEDSEIATTLDQLSWFASLDIVKLVGSLMTGLLTYRLGCRTVASTAALMFITSFLLYYYSATLTIVFASRMLGSLLSMKPLLHPYISEISEPQLRGPFLAICELAANIGLFFSLLLGSLIYWRTIALANLICPILVAITVLATPNSPTWLASKGRLGEAKKSLCWLRGWVQEDQVEMEFRALVESLDKSTPHKHKLEIEVVDWQTRSTHFFQLFLQRSFYRPLVTMCLIYFVLNLCGIGPLQSYMTIIFSKMNSPIEESLATAITGAMGIIGQLVILLSIRRVGKRKLTFSSVVVVGLCQAIVATIGFFNLQGDYLWIPPIAMIVMLFANYSGAGTIANMLNGEIFPSSVRYIGASIGIAVNMFMLATMNKLFLYVVDAITLSGVFLLFALMNVVALVTFYFVWPETEGKSLKEIQDDFEGIESSTKPERQNPSM